MNNCSFICEYFALIIIFIIALFFYDTKKPQEFVLRRRIYGASIALCAISAVLGIICSTADGKPDVWLTKPLIYLNSMYFITLWGMVSVLAYYLILRLYEFANNSRGLHIANVINFCIFAVFVCFLRYNYTSGIFFFIDDSGEYCRGWLKEFAYMMPVSEICLVLLVYVFNRNSISSTTRKLLLVMGSVAAALILFQYMYPEHRINSLICATVNLVVFIAYNGGRTEQDTLTGLPNRRCLLTELKYRTKRKEEYQLILIKLRHLSKINSLYGDNAGNAIILQIARAIRHISANSKAFRYADDEFIILFSGVEMSLNADRLQEVERMMNRMWYVEGMSIPIKFTVIDFIYEGQHWAFDDVRRYINEAIIYSSTKELNIVSFDETLVMKQKRKEYILELTREAIKENRFEVWYQPVYYHQSGKFESAEALMRMYDRNGKMISPKEFVPIAEESGLIDEITLFAVENVCRFFASGRISEMEKVNVNVPVRQIISKEFFGKLRDIMKNYDIPPERIRFEITERDMEEKGESVADAMCELHSKGYRFMLDDFGIGYSNFSRVIDMTLDGIKIDRSLVLQMNKGECHKKLIKDALVSVLHQTGCFIVAEGVETAEMAEAVLDCNISIIQGFYFAKPMPERELISWYKGTERQNAPNSLGK